MITHEVLATLITKNGLSAYEDGLLKMSQPAVHLNAAPAPDESKIAVGASKFGGSPDLPAGFHWPQWQNTPLTFMGQVNLSEAAPYDADHLLPTSGWLHFFYDLAGKPWGAPDQKGRWQLFYTPDSAALTRTTPPATPIPAHALTFVQSWTIPVLADTHPEGVYNLVSHGESGVLTVRAESIDDYDGLRQAIEAPTTPLHQLIGNPAQLQDDIRAMSQYAAHGIDTGTVAKDDKRLAQLAPGINDWRLVWQIDSDQNVFGTTWGDSGCLYLCMPAAAIKARQFDSAWLIMQSD